MVKFNKFLEKKLEITRNDLEQRRADDIQRFTYVTVVFLPMGFATGVFSMSQAPAFRTWTSMLITGILILIGTVLLLVLAKTIERLLRRMYGRARDLLGRNGWPWPKHETQGDGSGEGGLGHMLDVMKEWMSSCFKKRTKQDDPEGGGNRGHS